MSTRGKTELHISWTAAAIVPGLLFAITATAEAAETNIRKSARCKATIEKGLQQIARRHALARGFCAERQISGSLHDGADCMATPRPLGGPGVGHQDIDARFAGIRRKLRRVALRVAKTCPPPEYSPRLLGLDQLCPDPDDAASNYGRMMECGYDLIQASADRLQALVYKGPGNAAAQMSREEAVCRSALSENLRRVLRGRISARSECFKRYNRGHHQLNCMATSAAPGTREATGVRSVDRELEERLRDFCAGLAAALEGSVSDVAQGILFVAPHGVTVSRGEIQGNASTTARGSYYDAMDADVTPLFRSMPA